MFKTANLFPSVYTATAAWVAQTPCGTVLDEERQRKFAESFLGRELTERDMGPLRCAREREGHGTKERGVWTPGKFNLLFSRTKQGGRCPMPIWIAAGGSPHNNRDGQYIRVPNGSRHIVCHWEKPADITTEEIKMQEAQMKTAEIRSLTSPSLRDVLANSPWRTVAKVWFTVTMAREWLADQRKNRPVSPNTVNTYAKDMVAKQFLALFNDPVCTDEQDRGANGQHRMEAIIRAASIDPTFVGLYLYLARGLTEAEITVLDRGRKRTVGDVLHMRDLNDVLGIGTHKNTNTLAAAIRNVLEYRRWSSGEPGGSFFGSASSALTLTEADAFTAAHPEIADSVTWGVAVLKIAPPSMAAALHFLFSRIDKVAADKFFFDLETGANLSEDDPVHVVREGLLARKATATQKSQTLPRNERAARLIRAWNHRRSGVHSTMQIKGGVKNKEGKMVWPKIES